VLVGISRTICSYVTDRERINRTIKEATVKRFHNDSHAQLEQHMFDVINAYSFAKRLMTLRGLTPYEFICKPGVIS
jgi:hypothetical protein